MSRRLISFDIRTKAPNAALLLAALLCLISPLGAQAGAGKDAVQSLVGIFVHWNGSTADQASYAKAAQYIDYRVMSERVLGQKVWDDLSGQQRSDFQTSFRHLIEARYYPRWRKIFSHATVNVLAERASGRDIVVSTRVTTKDSPQDIVWTVSQVGGSDRVISLKVGDRDLLGRASLRFQRKLAKCSFDNFMLWMKKESLRGASADEESPQS